MLDETLEDLKIELTKIYFKNKNENGTITMSRSELASFIVDVVMLVKKIYC